MQEYENYEIKQKRRKRTIFIAIIVSVVLAFILMMLAVCLKIYYPTKEHTVQFLNYDMSVFDVKKVKDGKDAPLPSDEPTRIGYTFMGWEDHTKIDKDRDIASKWEANNYQVSFDAQGGEVLTTSKTVKFDNKYGELPIPEKNIYGYNVVFEGWFTSIDGNIKIEDDTIVSVAENHTLYARYSEEPIKAKLNFDAMGGEVDIAFKEITFDAEYGELPTPIKTVEGYSVYFDGWYTEPIGGVAIDERTISTAIGDITVYAHYTQMLNNVIITFDAQGGVCDTASKGGVYGMQYGELPIPTKFGYDFDGWFTEIEGGTIIDSSKIIENSENHTLYARWSLKNITVTFDAAGGECSVLSKTVTFSQAFGTLPIPTKTGYNFVGWFTQINGGVLIDSTTIMDKEDIFVLYAHWEAKSFHVSFDSQGGESSISSKSVVFDQAYGELPIPTKSVYGYEVTFDGWYTALEGGNKIDENTLVLIDENQTLYARYTQTPKQFVLTFDAQGGESSISSKTITFGSKIGDLPTPILEGYEFLGWFSGITDGERIFASTVITVEGSRTIFARWKQKLTGYLLKDWIGTLTTSNANYTRDKIATIVFTNTRPSGGEWVSVGATAVDGATPYVAGTPDVYDVLAYVSPNLSDSTKYDVVIFSEATIYAPQDSSYLFSNSKSEYSSPAPAFYSNLNSIDFGNFRTDYVQNMEAMFKKCTKITGLNLLNFETLNVVNLSSMFEGCELLNSLDFSSFNTSNVTNMSSMFEDCWKLSNLELSSFNTSNVTNMESMFSSCVSLTTLDLSNFNTSNLTFEGIVSVFSGCAKLEMLDLSSWDLSGVVISEGIDSISLSIVSLQFFLGSDSLREIKTPRKMAEGFNLVLPSYAIWSEKGNGTIAYSGLGASTNGKTLVAGEALVFLAGYWKELLSDANADFTKDKIKTISFTSTLPTGEGYTLVQVGSIDSLGEEVSENIVIAYVKASAEDSTKYDVIFYSSRKIHAPIATEGLFEDLTNLTSITFDNFSTSQAYMMYSMFAECSSLTSLDVSSFDTSKVIMMDGMFMGCSSLKSLDLSSWDMRNVITISSLFAGCSSLESVNLSSLDLSKISFDMYGSGSAVSESIFMECGSLKEIKTPSKIGDSISLPTTGAWYGKDTTTIYTKLDSTNLNKTLICKIPAFLSKNWQTALTAVDANFAAPNIKTIAFANTIPNGEGFVQVQVGCITASATDIVDGVVVAYIKANVEDSTKYDVIFYCPETILAPEDSNFLFSNAGGEPDKMFVNLTSLDFSNFSTSYAASMSGMFAGCMALETINLLGFDTGKVVNMSYMFMYCFRLKSLDLSSFNTSNVVSMEGMFAMDFNLASINFSSFNTTNVSNFADMFLGLETDSERQEVVEMFGLTLDETLPKLQELDLSSFRISASARTRDMLLGQESLRKIKTPAEVMTEIALPEGSYWFNEITNSGPYEYIGELNQNSTLIGKEINYLSKNWQNALISANANFKQANIKNISFVSLAPSDEGCTLVQVGSKDGINISHGVIVAYVKANAADSTKFDVVFYCPTTIYAPADSSQLFSTDVSSLNEKDIPSNTFWWLESISFENFSVSTAENAREMFAYCASLQQLDLSQFEFISANQTENMFKSCLSLTTIKTPKSINEIIPLPGGHWFIENTEIGPYTQISSELTSRVLVLQQNVLSKDWREIINVEESKVTSIKFTRTLPNNGEYYVCNVGSTDIEGTDKNGLVYAFLKQPNSEVEEFELVIYSPTIIYAPKDSSNLFGGSRKSWIQNTFTYVQKIDFENFNTSNVTTMKAMFSEFMKYSLLKGMEVSTYASKLEFYQAFNKMFDEDRPILDLSGFDTSNVTSMAGMFAFCGARMLDISSFDMTNVTDASGMFTYSDEIKKIRTPKIIPNSFKIWDYLTDEEKPSDMSPAEWEMAKGLRCFWFVEGDYDNKFLDLDSSLAGKTIERCDFYGASLTPNYLNSLETDYTNAKLKTIKFTSTRPTEEEINSDRFVGAVPSGSYFNNDLWYSGSISQFRMSCSILSFLFKNASDNTKYDLIVYSPDKIFLGPKTSLFNSGYGEYTSLVSALFENFDTRFSTTMSKMFMMCSSLKTLDLSVFDTSNVTDMSYMFALTALESLNLSSFDTSNVTDMSYMFFGMCGIEINESASTFEEMYKISKSQLDLSNFNTQNVTNMFGMFADCAGLTSLNLTGWNTAKVTNMKSMFQGCFSLSNLDLSSFNTSSVVDMSHMFDMQGTGISYVGMIFQEYLAPLKDSLSSIDLSSFNTSNVTDMSFMFNMCMNLSELNLSSFNTQNVTTMSAMFESCVKLSNLILSENFKTDNVTDMSAMFANCFGFTSLDLSNFNTSKVSNMNAMFACVTPAEFKEVTHVDISDDIKLTYLNISSFDLSSVEDALNFIKGQTSLNLIKTPTKMGATVIALINGKWYCQETNEGPYGTVDSHNVGKTLEIREDSLNLAVLSKDWVEIIENAVKGCYGYSTIYNISFSNTIPTGAEYTLVQVGCGDITGTSVIDGKIVAYVSKIKIGENEEQYYITFYSPETIYAPADSTGLFKDLRKCSSLTLNNFDTSYVTSMASMFENNPAYFDVANFNTTNVVNMSNMFANTKRGTITLTSFNTQNVRSMAGMFKNSGFSSIDLSSFNTSKVTDMSNMFSGCVNLPSLDLAHFDVSNVTKFENMFKDCSLITTLDLSGFRPIYVETIRGMFSGCARLETVNLSGFNTEKVTDFSNLFNGCALINSLDLSSFNTMNAKTIEGMFKGCAKLSTLNISKFNFTNLESFSNWLSGCGVTSLEFNDLGTIKTNNLSYLFANLSSLEHLVIRAIDTSNATNMSDMFDGCSKLETLDVSMFNTTNVTDMRYMFRGCSSLTSLNLSGFNTSNVTNMFYMFKGCSSLTSLDLSSFNTSNVTDMYGMFSNCKKLTNLVLASFNTSNVTNMSYMFENCQLLTIFDVAGFDTSNVENISGMFMGCKSVETLNISHFNIEKVTGYLSKMFKDCSSLKSIDFIRNWDTKNITKMDDMLSGCSSLTELNLSGLDLSSLQKLGLSNCSNIQKIIFPVNINSGAYIIFPDNFVLEDDVNGEIYCKFKSTLAGKTLVKKDLGKNFLVLDWRSLIRSGTKYYPNDVKQIIFTNTIPEYYDIKFPVGTYLISGEGDANSSVVAYISTLNEYNYKLYFYSDKPIYLPRITNSNLFGGLKLLTLFDGKNLRFDYATSLGSMFSGCEKLETINIPVLNAKNVTLMAYMFSGCSLLKNLTLSVFCTDNVTDVERMFYNCSELESLDLSGFNFSSVTSSSNMFGGASKLRKIILPNLISDNFSTILPAGFKILDEGSTVYFAYEKALKGKTLVKANDLAFLRKDWEEAVATAVNLREWDLKQKISSISFTQTAPSSYYRRVAVGGNSPYIGSTSVPMSNLVYAYVVSVGQTYSIIFRSSQVIYASEGLNFKWLSNMISISLDNFSTYYLTNFNDMFSNCTKLASIDLKQLITSSATSMNGMFVGCSSLTSLDLSGFKTSGVTDMGYMFAGCSLLTSLDLSNFNTARVTNMSNMFKGCSSLSSVNLSSFNTSNVTNMEYMFANCSSLTSLNVSSFNTSKVTSFKSMFNNCSALTELDLSSFEITSEAGNVWSMLEQKGDFALRKIIAPKVIAGYNYISLPSLSTGGKWCKLGEETVTVTQLRKEQEGQTFIYIVSETT